MQATKLKEVWRVNGRFAKAPEPVVEIPEQPLKDESGAIIGVIVIGMSIGLFAIVFYKVTLAILAASAISYAIYHQIQTRREYASKSKLNVNYSGKSTTIYL